MRHKSLYIPSSIADKGDLPARVQWFFYDFLTNAEALLCMNCMNLYNCMLLVPLRTKYNIQKPGCNSAAETPVLSSFWLNMHENAMSLRSTERDMGIEMR